MKSMEHWKGNQMCAIDTETSGLDAHFHEILQICILPLTSELEPRKHFLPFCIDLKPDCPERADPKALEINQLDICNLVLKGFDKEKAKDLLLNWIEKLELPFDLKGNKCKIRPLGQNYSFDRDFIIRWLGIDMYNEFFDYHYADTMTTAIYLNDHAAMHGNRPPFQYTSLGALAKQYFIDTGQRHSALSDCVTTAAVYKKMTQQGLLG